MCEMSEDVKTITIMNEEGEEVNCLILFTFYLEEFDRSYVVYFEEDQAGDEEVDLLVSSYLEDDGKNSGKLLDIETDEEWDAIDEVIQKFLDEMEG